MVQEVGEARVDVERFERRGWSRGVEADALFGAKGSQFGSSKVSGRDCSGIKVSYKIPAPLRREHLVLRPLPRRRCWNRKDSTRRSVPRCSRLCDGGRRILNACPRRELGRGVWGGKACRGALMGGERWGTWFLTRPTPATGREQGFRWLACTGRRLLACTCSEAPCRWRRGRRKRPSSEARFRARGGCLDNSPAQFRAQAGAKFLNDPSQNASVEQEGTSWCAVASS